MVMGDLCTRRCPFCDVAHGRPNPLDVDEPQHLAEAVAAMGLKYVVITSVDRDDLRDGGAGHFAACVDAVRSQSPKTRIEILVPDFRGRMDRAMAALGEAPPDVFNHNLETVPRLYKKARPGSDYAWVAQSHQDVQAGTPERADQVRHYVRTRRNARGSTGSLVRSARSRVRYVDAGAISTTESVSSQSRAILAPR